MITIPTISTGKVFEYRQGILLDGSLFALKLSWNARIDHWLLSLYLPDETPIVAGRMVINGIDLLRGCVVAGRPAGALFAAPVDGTTAHAGLTGLGSRVLLYYRELSDG
jgi:hypothetical protein